MKLVSTFSTNALSVVVASELPKIRNSEYESIRETYPLLKMALRSEDGLKELLGYMQNDFETRFLSGDSVSINMLAFSALLDMGSSLREELEK